MTSNVFCGYTGAAWEENSHGQNACVVYAELQGLCNSSFVINSVTSSSPPYQPPINACGCNVVAYNLMAACGWCQSTIPTTWWLTENQWANACTAASYDSLGVPSTVTDRSAYSSIDIPSWAFATPTGITWSPGQALYDSQHSGNQGPDGGKVAGIVVGVILGLYALLAIAIIVIYIMRQKKRKAWYVPMGQYYAGLRSGGANQPLVYNPNNMVPYSPPKATFGTPLSNSGYTYQPPPPETPAPAYKPGYTTGAPGNTMYGTPQPPPGAAASGQGGFKGYAEVY